MADPIAGFAVNFAHIIKGIGGPKKKENKQKSEQAQQELLATPGAPGIPPTPGVVDTAKFRLSLPQNTLNPSSDLLSQLLSQKTLIR